MKFEVNKFLAFTALLAGASVAAAGCSSDDSKVAPGGSNAGEAGERAVIPAAGAGNATSEAGAGGVGEGQGGASSEAGAAGAKEAQGGASEGGARDDGGAAGASVVGSCISDVVGEAGASAEFPCEIWTATDVPDCSGEGTNRAGDLCQILDNSGAYRPNVLAAYNVCAKKLADSCNVTDVSNCALGLVGEGCTQPTTAANCALIQSHCAGATLCTNVLDLATASGQAAIADCMDPAGENYDPYTAAPNLDCNMNLRYCASLPVVAQPSTL